MDVDSDQSEVRFKALDEILVAQTRIHGTFNDIPNEFERINQIVGNHRIGNPIVVHHWGVSDDKGHDMDVCVPIDEPIEKDEITVTKLSMQEAMTTIHKGPYSEIGDAYRRVSQHTYERGHPIAESTREVYHHLKTDNPEESVIEIQSILHDWTPRFSSQLETILGRDVKEKVLEPMSDLQIDSTATVRQKALCKSLKILEENSNEQQQYEVLSHCAHVFPIELIPPMRDLFRSTGNVDTVIEAMISEGGFYPKLLRREGHIIYSEKGPANPAAFKAAKTAAEKRKAYCFCPLIRDCIEEAPEIFCNCAAGWPKQLWEGILEKPLTIEITKSLTKGDDTCEFAIHLPSELV
jgi:effector-binding domain-containing protein